MHICILLSLALVCVCALGLLVTSSMWVCVQELVFLHLHVMKVIVIITFI